MFCNFFIWAGFPFVMEIILGALSKFSVAPYSWEVKLWQDHANLGREKTLGWVSAWPGPRYWTSDKLLPLLSLDFLIWRMTTTTPTPRKSRGLTQLMGWKHQPRRTHQTIACRRSRMTRGFETSPLSSASCHFCSFYQQSHVHEHETGFCVSSLFFPDILPARLVADHSEFGTSEL